MKCLITASAVALGLAGAILLPTGAADAQGKPAAPPAAKPAKAADTLKCPSCGMAMPTKKAAATPVPVKVDGKLYYCCAGCDSGKKAVAYSKAHKGAILNVSTKPAAAKSGAKKS
jgi:hypothetical protein